ncbi:MAG TPA: hypothetical protein VF778_12040, partial [Xanthobacteraceae bacterium]
AGALLAVAQGGVENDDAVLIGLGCRGHGVWSFFVGASPLAWGFGRFWVPVAYLKPLSAQAQMPRRPSGGHKEQEPAKNERSAGTSRFGSPFDRWQIAANRHALSHRLKGCGEG